MTTKEYCYYCDDEREYKIKEEIVKMNIKEIEFEYLANVAYCTDCGKEIYIAELDDENIRRANKKYRELQEVIQISEIEEVLHKYNIGKKPLSLLLGWGETTIIRYLNGLTPSKEYSEKLKEILNNPYKMKEIFDKNKAVLSDIAKKKLETKLNSILNHSSKEDTLFNVANFFLSKIDEESGTVITHLKLQKLVYYVQAWSLAFFNKPFINQECQAWVHGPVFPELYDHFKYLRYNPIPKVNNFDENIFTNDELNLLKTIWKVYGKYSAKYLENITHIEDPWNISRKNCSSNERCNEIINIDSIKKYYTHIKTINNIENDEALNKYVSNISV